MKVPLPLLAVLPLFAMSADTPATSAPLSAADLYESCTAHVEAAGSPQSLVCTSYIQGFLDSARSGAEILTERADGLAAPETWEERAARTRLGKNYLESLRKRDHLFCLSASVTLDEIVGQLTEHLRTDPPSPRASAAEALVTTLRRHHSCDG